MNKKLIVIAALLSIAGSQLMAEGCNACAMKHGSTKEEREEYREEKKERREARRKAHKEEKKSKKHTTKASKNK
jgi:hypothetical protein